MQIDYQKKRSYLESVYAKTDANGNILKEANGNTVWIRDDVNIDAEVTADLVGDYLFTDEDFIRNLSAKHQNLFQKVYAEIKYLLKSATAGSTEARKLEKVKKMFDKAYRESTEAQKNTTEDGGVKYSIINLDSGKSYVQASRQIIHGSSIAEWRSQITEFFNRALKDGPIEIETIEGDMLTISRNTADKARSKTTTENGISRELTDKEFLVKLHAEAHVDELAEISLKHRRPPVPDGKNHSFAKDGFTYRTAYFQDFDGSYYKITLSIGHNGNVATVYNVGKIKADDIPDGKIISTIGSKADMSSTKYSISNANENVNTDFSLSTPTEGIAPVGNFNIHGWDIADIDAPIRDDINGGDRKETTESGIRDQLRSNQDTLNDMGIVANIQVPEEYGQLDIAEKKKRVVEKLYPTGYKVNRKGFGVIEFARKQLKSAFNYFNKGSVEETAFEALPSVLKNGIEISERTQHKGRDYGTVTIAAPIAINGKRGNMAVVVKKTTGNYYKVHRILTPDGSEFVLPETTNEAESTLAGELPKNGSLATPKDSASTISIPENGKVVKGIRDDSMAMEFTDSTHEDAMRMEAERELHGPWRMTDPLDQRVEKLYRMMLRGEVSEEDYIAQLVKADRQYQQRGSRVEEALERVWEAYNKETTATPETEKKMERLTRKVLRSANANTSLPCVKEGGSRRLPGGLFRRTIPQAKPVVLPAPFAQGSQRHNGT